MRKRICREKDKQWVKHYIRIQICKYMKNLQTYKMKNRKNFLNILHNIRSKIVIIFPPKKSTLKNCKRILCLSEDKIVIHNHV